MQHLPRMRAHRSERLSDASNCRIHVQKLIRFRRLSVSAQLDTLSKPVARFSGARAPFAVPQAHV